MATCELCGKEGASLSSTKIAGSVMSLCSSCNRHGRSTEPQAPQSFTFKKRKKEENSLAVVSNYASLINSALSRKGFDLHQLARAVNIKESSLNKYATGKIKPDVQAAQKIARFLDINLTEEGGSENVEDYMQEEKEDEGKSLGDLLLKQLEKKNNGN